MKSLMEFLDRVWAEILRRIGLAYLLARASFVDLKPARFGAVTAVDERRRLRVSR
jgi:hypothetical protein